MTNPTAPPQVLEYWIDGHDRLIQLGEGWHSTTQTVEAAHLVADNVLHQPLWSFISDRTTRFIYRLLVDRIRLRQVPIRLTARCDTPDARRTIEIEMRTEADRLLRFISTVTQIETRSPVALLDVTIPRAETLVILCSWCKRVELPNGRWVEIEEAVPTLDILNQVPLPQISHGMCLDCLRKMKQDIARQL